MYETRYFSGVIAILKLSLIKNLYLLILTQICRFICTNRSEDVIHITEGIVLGKLSFYLNSQVGFVMKRHCLNDLT